MKLSDLRPAAGSHKTARRVGRGHGSGRGKTSGRGQKGQKARTGGTIRRYFNGGQNRMSKRLPFLRGMGAARNTIPNHEFYTILNVGELNELEAGSQVSLEILSEYGVISASDAKGRLKILGDGELDRALTVKAHKFSASAKAKIEAAGGSAEIIPVKVYEQTKRRKDEQGKITAPPSYKA